MTTSSSKPIRQAQGHGPAVSMAELMARTGNHVTALQKGQIIEGTISSIIHGEIMVHTTDNKDVLAVEKNKNLLKHLLATVKEGDSIQATVLYPESDAGYPLVSLRNFMEEKVWQELKKLQETGAKMSVTVVESTKGGMVVETDFGQSGFLPNSHMTGEKKGESLVGKRLQVTIAELQKETRKVVFSQKPNLTQDDFVKLSKQYVAGTKVNGKVSGITQFGIFVSLPYQKSNETVFVDGLVHISEISWEKVEDLHSLFVVGQTVEAVVIGTDTRSKRIDLSIKRLSGDPFQKVVDAFPMDKRVTGTAQEMTELGLVIDLGIVAGVPVEGLIKKDKIPAGVTYEKGKQITATVVLVDSKKRKVMLTPVLLEKPLMYR